MNFCPYFPQCTPTALSVSENPLAGKLILIRVISCLSFNAIVVIISVYTLRFKDSLLFFDSFFIVSMLKKIQCFVFWTVHFQ